MPVSHIMRPARFGSIIIPSFGTISQSEVEGLTSTEPSHSHNVEAGTDHLLGIGFFGDPFNIGSQSLNAFTFGAGSLLSNALIAFVSDASGNSIANHFVYRLASPSGNQTLTYDITGGDARTWGRALIGIDVKDASSFNVVKARTVTTAGITSISDTVTSTVANSILLMVAGIGKNAQGGLVTPAANMNELIDFDMGTADIQMPTCWVGWRNTGAPGSYGVGCSWPDATPANRFSSYSVIEIIP